MKKYEVNYEDGEDTVANSFAEAINAIQKRLKDEWCEGWFLDGDLTEDHFGLDGSGCREWAICRNIAVKNSRRLYAVIEEVEED